jgi:hypothetical protein
MTEPIGADVVVTDLYHPFDAHGLPREALGTAPGSRLDRLAWRL